MFLPPLIRVLVTGPASRDLHAIDSWLSRQDSIQLLGASAHGGEPSRPPDVVVVRAQHASDAARIVTDLISRHEGVRAIVVAREIGADDAAKLLTEGARGVLAMDELQAKGLRALREVARGEIWGPRSALTRIVNASIRQSLKERAVQKGLPGLTAREISIVSLLQRGSSNKEIAANLGISDKTVKTHLQNIYGKLHVRRRQEVFSLARAPSSSAGLGAGPGAGAHEG